MNPTIERKYPETMQMEEYLVKQKKNRKKQKDQLEDMIRENAAWIVAAFSM